MCSGPERFVLEASDEVSPDQPTTNTQSPKKADKSVKLATFCVFTL